MNENILVVNVNNMNVYSFLRDGEKKEELLKRAEDYRQKEINSYKELLKKYNNPIYKNSLKEYQEAEYKIMTYDEFIILEKKFYTDREVTEITKEEYEEALNVLPPILPCTINGGDMFCMSEFYTSTFTEQYAKKGSKYYCKMVDVKDKNTWIYNYL